MDYDKPNKSLKEQSAFRFMGDVSEAGPRLKIGVVGATGVVGAKLLQVLHERNFPFGEIHIYASTRSEGRWIKTPFDQLCIEALNSKKPPYLDLVFMAAGSAVARTWGWRFAHRGAIVIDKSSYFRDKRYAPLVVPEVNADVLDDNRGIIANPNCTTIPLVTALAPLHEAFRLKTITAVSFQSVSGSGNKGMVALVEELEDTETEPTAFPHRIAHNIIPWIGSNRNGFSGEEMKMIDETRKILSLPRLPIRVTAVRVPIMIGHSIAVHASFRRSLTVEKAKAALDGAPGITLLDDPTADLYPTPLQAAGRDDVLVGRIRRDRGRSGLAFWISTDNLRKGAATNAVQIAEELLLRELIRETA